MLYANFLFPCIKTIIFHCKIYVFILNALYILRINTSGSEKYGSDPSNPTYYSIQMDKEKVKINTKSKVERTNAFGYEPLEFDQINLSRLILSQNLTNESFKAFCMTYIKIFFTYEFPVFLLVYR